jgi:hypothetical protein
VTSISIAFFQTATLNILKSALLREIGVKISEKS